MCLSTLLCAILWVSPVMGQGGKIIINIKGLEAAKGSLRVALYNKPDDFPDAQRTLTAQVLPLNSQATTASLTFENLPKGVYAAAVYQDINKNGKLDANAMGIPTEPYGFSNNPRVKWSAPKFESAVFELKEKNQTLDIEVKRWKSW